MRRTPRMKPALVALLATSLAWIACTNPEDPTVITGPRTRYLPTLSLSVGQRADIAPDTSAKYDSLAVTRSSGMAFLGMERDTFFTPEGPAGEPQQVFHFQAQGTGRSVVTIRYTDGTAAVQDTIDVEPAPAHGPFAQVVTGFFTNSCALTTAGAAYCWGGRASVATVAGTSTDRTSIYQNTPGPLAGNLTFAAISQGFAHSCGVTTAGAAYCWGINDNGQLGDGSTQASAVPVPVTGGLTFSAMSAGAYHTCGLTTAGAIYCWGNDFDGELGNGTTSNPYNNPNPIHVSSDSTFIAVAVGYQYSCGVTTGGAAFCWGDNDKGQLGNGSQKAALVPMPVSGGLTFVALSAGYYHACGVASNGHTYCWGGNTYGQLGDGTTEDATRPVAVGKFSAVSAGEMATCAVQTGGDAFCWGRNDYGQLGDTEIPLAIRNPLPLPVSGNLTFSTISTGYLHTCGVTTGGTTYCWGDNSDGEVGDGSVTFRPGPTRVFGG